jgi:TRAP-type C4-dicarboxylate transport system permease small subunit
MLDRIERILVAGNRWLLILLLLAMACIVFANVVLRYTTGDSIVWAEEVARHMMIWVTFLGAGLVLRFGGHVAIDNLHRSVSTRKAQAMRGFVVLILASSLP